MDGYMKSLLFLVFALSSLAGFAQDRAFDCPESGIYAQARSRNLLDQVQKAYAGINTIEAGFEQRSYVDALEVSESSYGRVYFKKPGLMKWHYNAPSEQIFVVRDGTLWLYQVEARQIIIDDFKETLISDLPVSFLLGIGDIKKDFRLLKACQNARGIVLDLAPARNTGKEAEMQSFKLMVDADTFLPAGAFIVDIANNSTAMLLSGIALNAQLPENAFSTEFGGGLDISDRRIERRRTEK